MGGRAAHVFALSTFAIAQPLFAVLAENPEFFAARGSSPGEIWAFTLAVSLGPGVVLLAVEALLAAAKPQLGRIFHLLVITFLSALAVVQLLERLGWRSPAALLIACSALAGAAFAYVFARAASVRSFLTILGPAPLVAAAFFVFASPVARLANPPDAGAVTAEIDSATPVVVMVFDELPLNSLLDRNGGVDGSRYPRFAELAATSTWFRNTTTVSAWTEVAAPALLTGRRPKPDRLPAFVDHPRNLFTFLGGSHRLNVRQLATSLCPRELCRADVGARRASLVSDTWILYQHLVAPPALEERLPPLTDTWVGFAEAAEETAGERRGVKATRRVRWRDVARARLARRHQGFRRFVRSVEPSTEPVLHYLHVRLPHAPWLYFPSGRRTAIPGPPAGLVIASDRWTGDPWLALQAKGRHLLQLMFVDRLLGELVDRLRKVGLYDRSLLVVVADHGVSFRPGDEKRRATRTNLEDIAYVPLFVKTPHQRRGAVIDAHVEVIDVLPTIADALDVELPWAVDGRSAFRPADRPNVVIDELSLPIEALERRRRAALRRQLEAFGSGDGGAGIFAAVPLPALLGRAVAELPQGPQSPAHVRLDDVERRLLELPVSDWPVVPSPLQGRVEGLDEGSTLAVSVNGRIAAVAATYSADGQHRFSALVPEHAFRGGRNDVALFHVDSTGGFSHLRRLAILE